MTVYQVFNISKKYDPTKALYKESKELGEGKVRGYDFGKDFDAKGFFASFKETGFQASNLGRAIDLVKQMQKERVTIFLGFTSNISSSGLRDIITYLVRNNLVHFLVTTTGGLEEDIIKTHGAFLHGIETGLDLKGCAVLASAVATLNTRKLGGRSALPTMEEAVRFMERHAGLKL